MRHPVWGEAGWFDSLGSSRLVLKVGPACRCLPLRLRTACQVFACRQEQAPERPLAAKVGGGIGDQGSRTNDQGNDGDDGPTSILKGDGFLQKSSRWDGLSKNYLRLWNFHKFPLQKEGNHTWKTQTQQKQLPFWKNNVFLQVVDSQRLLLMAENPEDVVKKLESEAGESQQMEFFQTQSVEPDFSLRNIFGEYFFKCLWGMFSLGNILF